MDHSCGPFGTIITLLIISHLELWSCQDIQESLTAINVELHPDLQHQQLAVQWTIAGGLHPSGRDITFHLQVARSRNMNIIQEEYFTSRYEDGAPFRWGWDSELPLECDSHSLRMRGGLPSEGLWSSWSEWKTHHGRNMEDRSHIQIYPEEKIALEGSDVVFCCLPPKTATVMKMTYGLTEYPNQSKRMNTESFVIKVEKVTLTKSDGDNAVCWLDDEEDNGTVLIVTRPPDEPKDFSCETRDLKELRCTWKPGPRYNFFGDLEEQYTLRDRVSGKVSSCSRQSCSWPIEEEQKGYNFTLTVTNVMGQRSINATVCLKERVIPVVATKLIATDVTATHAVLSWSLEMDYRPIVLHCETNLLKSTVKATFTGKSPKERYSVSLSQLHPFTKYEPRVRCAAEESLAGWSAWSEAVVIQTQEHAPSAPVDVWREIRDHKTNRIVTLHWRPLPDSSANGNILHYHLNWSSLEGHMRTNTTRVPANHTHYNLSIGNQAYIIGIMAQNRAGVSPAARIKVPAAKHRGHKEVYTERAMAKDGGISVSWRPEAAVHGYVIEWCRHPHAPHCTLQWKKYNSSIHTDLIKSAEFRPGVRYDFRIYGSKEDGEHLLGILKGYSQEQVSSKKPNATVTKIDGRSLTLDWSPYSLNDAQEGFVEGYTIYVTNTEGKCDLKTSNRTSIDGVEMCTFSIRDPDTMSTTITGLKPDTEYAMSVVAVTGEGETNKTFFKVSTPADAGAVILSILMPVIIVSLLAVLLLIAGCWKRAWLKEICCPDIPDPNKSKVLSLISRKDPAKRYLAPTSNSCTQKVERIHILEKEKGFSHELMETPSQQSGIPYTTIQSPDNRSCTEGTSDLYINTDTDQEYSTNPAPEEPPYRLQPPTYREFFNRNYSGTLEKAPEDVPTQGYRPQADAAPLNESSGEGQVVSVCLPYRDLTSDLELTFKGFESLTVSEAEPTSPTSVTSTSCILTA